MSSDAGRRRRIFNPVTLVAAVACWVVIMIVFDLGRVFAWVATIAIGLVAAMGFLGLLAGMVDQRRARGVRR